MSFKIVEMGSRASGGLAPLLNYALLDVFTRASEAPFLDPRGPWAYQGGSEAANNLAVDIKRLFSDGAILIEQASTNHAVASEILDDTIWVKLNSPTITIDAGTAPDLGADADDLNHTADQFSQIQQQTALASTVDNGPAALSAWSQAASGTIDWRLGFVDRAGVSGPLDPKTATTTFLRAILLISDVGAGGPSIGVKIAMLNALAGGIKTVRQWGAMLEGTFFVSSYIRTPAGATATRPNEDARFGAGKWESLKTGDFEVVVHPLWDTTDTPATGTRHTVYNGSLTDDRIDFRFTGTAWEVRYRENTPLVSSVVTGLVFGFGDFVTLRVSRSTGKLQASVNGGAFTDGSAITAAGWTSPGQLFVGQDSVNSNHVDGVIEQPVRP